MGFIGGMFNFAAGVAKASYSTSLWTANSIHTAIQNARTNKEINKIYKNAAETNFINRTVLVMPGINKQQLLLESSSPDDNDVYDYNYSGTSPGMDMIWGSAALPQGEVVSGGTNHDRADALMPFIHKSQQENIGVIVLHTGNNDLMRVVGGHCVADEYISKGKAYFDIFRGMPVDDITFLLYELMMQEGVSPNAESLLRALIEVVLCQNGSVTLNNLSNFPIMNLKQELDDLLSSGVITKDEHADIQRYYLAGSTELSAVRIFLGKLGRQADNVFGSPMGLNSNIKKTLNLRGVEAIDIGTVNNDIIIELVIQYLMLLQSQGKDFSIVIDGLQISKYPKIMDLLRGRTYAISNQDVIASLKGGTTRSEELFSELMGNVDVVVLFRHTSGDSRKKWSEYMGTYKKIRIRKNISQNNAFMNSNDSRGISVDESEEPRIRPETLEKLYGTMACIYRTEGILIAQVQ